MEAQAPGRVIRFNLDAMLAAPDRQAWVEATLLAPLALSTADFRKPFADLGNTNSALLKYGRDPAPLPDRDARELDRALGRQIAAYFSARDA